jgi:nitroreductase
MDLSDAIYGRRAVRAYTTARVPDDLIHRLLDAAVQAPSAMNRQPWAFAIVQDLSLLDHFAARAKSYVLDTMPVEGPLGAFRPTLADSAYHLFHHAPTLIIVCARPDAATIAEDCALAAQNLMLAAHGMGLGTCWIGLARDWLGLPAVKAELGVPLDHIPVAPIVVGAPGAPTAAHGREPPRIVTWKR